MNIADWLIGIVGDRIRPDLQVLKLHRTARFRFAELEEFSQSHFSTAEGSRGSKHRQTATPGEDADPSYMIVVLVGDKNCIQITRFPADALQAGSDFLSRKAVVDEDRGFS
jgi:hypothetical protein